MVFRAPMASSPALLYLSCWDGALAVGPLVWLAGCWNHLAGPVPAQVNKPRAKRCSEVSSFVIVAKWDNAVLGGWSTWPTVVNDLLACVNQFYYYFFKYLITHSNPGNTLTSESQNHLENVFPWFLSAVCNPPTPLHWSCLSCLNDVPTNEPICISATWKARSHLGPAGKWLMTRPSDLHS